VRTIGELEVIEHVERGLPSVDTRLAQFYAEGTIPGTRSIPHEEILDHLDRLDPGLPTVLICKGPHSATTDGLPAGGPSRSVATAA
jgi:hypothetical protein